MAFAPMTLASPPSPACLCPRISNSFAAYLAVLVSTVSPCLMAYHIRPVTALLKKGAAFEFASAVEDTVRTLLAELAAPPILVFPDWDAVIDTSRPLRLHCDASTAGLGATLDNEQNWTPMELEAGCVVWSIRPLRRYLFGVYFLVFTDHQCLQQICKIGATKPRIQRWMDLSAYADFLSRLPLPPIADNVSGASALTDPDDLGVYLIRACRLTTPSCPVPGVGLGGLVPSPDIPVLGGLAPSPDIPVLGGLPLTSDDFQTHRDPLPSPSATTCPRRPRATFPQAPCTTYAINAATVPHDPHDGHEAKPRSWMVIPHRAQTTARPPTMGSPRPPLQRLLRSARRRLRARPA